MWLLSCVVSTVECEVRNTDSAAATIVLHPILLDLGSRSFFHLCGNATLLILYEYEERVSPFENVSGIKFKIRVTFVRISST